MFQFLQLRERRDAPVLVINYYMGCGFQNLEMFERESRVALL